MSRLSEVMSIPERASTLVLRCLSEAIEVWQTAAIEEEGMTLAETQAVLVALRPQIEAFAQAKTDALVRYFLSLVDPEDLDAAALEALHSTGRVVSHPTHTWWEC